MIVVAVQSAPRRRLPATDVAAIPEPVHPHLVLVHQCFLRGGLYGGALGAAPGAFLFDARVTGPALTARPETGQGALPRDSPTRLGSRTAVLPLKPPPQPIPLSPNHKLTRQIPVRDPDRPRMIQHPVMPANSRRPATHPHPSLRIPHTGRPDFAANHLLRDQVGADEAAVARATALEEATGPAASATRRHRALPR